MVLLLTSCAADNTPTPATSGPPNGTALTVTVTGGENAVEWTVTCDPPGGTHPRPKSACDFLELARRWGQDPFAPVPADAVCSQVYGGAEAATVKGTWNGKPVDATFDRTNGCEIARWDNAVALLAVRGDPSAPPSSPRKR